MNIAGRLRALGEAPGGPFTDAFEAYAKRPQAPNGIKANPALYGELTRHYLVWSAGLLARMEDAAAARPSCQRLLPPLQAQVAAYLDHPARWPSVPLIDPATALVPAYYAVRAAQRVNAQVRPHLVEVAVDEPHAFAIEVLGGAASDQICAHKNADLRELPDVAQESGAVEALTYRAFLHGSQRTKLIHARATVPPPVVVSPAPPPPPVTSAPPPAPRPSTVNDEAEATRWTGSLGDRRIVLARTNTPPDGYGGGGAYVEHVRYLDLLSGGRYRLVDESSSHTSYAGLLSQGKQHRESHGAWEIHVVNGIVALLLIEDHGSRTMYSLRDRRPGAVIFDGQERAVERLPV